MRVAAVDLGTNSTRLLVADVDGGSLAEVRRETTITRLGEGVDARRRLLPVPIARVRNCLSGYRRTAERLGAERVLAVATSAFRDAENGEAFLGEVEWSYGFVTRLLTGEEEAELTRRGVGRPDALVVDLGGGSTELVGPGIRTSLDIGSVRLTERFLHGDPPAGEELDACVAAIRDVLPELEPGPAIGVAGTFTTLAALSFGGYDRARTHGFRLSRDLVDELTERLAGLPLEERRLLPGLEPERAPVIVAGALIVRELMAHAELSEIEVSEHDLLDGVARAAAELPGRDEGDAPPGAYTCC